MADLFSNVCNIKVSTHNLHKYSTFIKLVYNKNNHKERFTLQLLNSTGERELNRN